MSGLEQQITDAIGHGLWYSDVDPDSVLPEAAKAVMAIVQPVADERDRYAQLLNEASEALRAVGKAAIAVEPTLANPYPDAPHTSPWKRFMKAPAKRAYNLGWQIRKELTGVRRPSGQFPES